VAQKSEPGQPREMNHSFAYETGRTAEYDPESGKTWVTFVPSGNVPLPTEIAFVRMPSRSGPPRKEAIQRGTTEGFSIFPEAIPEEMALM